MDKSPQDIGKKIEELGCALMAAGTLFTSSLVLAGLLISVVLKGCS